MAAAALLRVFSGSTQLSGLDLFQSNIDDVAMEILAPVLGACSSMSEFAIPYNALGPRGCRALAQCLPELRQLQRMDLYQCRNVADGAEALAPALATLKSLESLVLTACGISATGCQILAQHMQQLPSLRHLDISPNNKTRAGVAELASALSSLTHLVCTSCGMRDADVALLVQQMSSMRLGSLLISTNSCSSSTACELVTQMASRAIVCDLEMPSLAASVMLLLSATSSPS
jgi:Ran GTPase-activating protein (RanGAP) involved in mRNA processing and transport